MLSKKLADVTIEDIQRLIDNEVSESKLLEYKRISTIFDEDQKETKDEKKEFLADISSFANAQGGDMIFGLGAQDGKPSKIYPIKIKYRDKLELKINQILESSLEPKIIGIDIGFIPAGDKQEYIPIIRIPQSWSAPHRIIQNAKGFWGRSSNKKFPMDIYDLKTSFTKTIGIEEQINKFIEQRRIKILMGRIHPNINITDTRAVLHFVPLSSFTTKEHYSLENFYKNNLNNLRPFGDYCSNFKYNLAGLLVYNDRNSYLQFFRNGIIEMISVEFPKVYKDIPSETLEIGIINSVKHTLELYKDQNINCPIYVFMSLLNVKGYKLATGVRTLWQELEGINEEHLDLPEIVINDFHDSPGEIVKPLLDILWNAFGYEKHFS